MARTIGCSGTSIGELHGVANVAIKTEAVRLEIAAVWTGRQQVYREVVGAVRGDGQIVGLGQMSNLHEDGDATTIGHVRFGIGYTARSDHLLELPKCAKILARSNGNATFARDAGVARHVVRDRRFLQPDEVVIAESASAADRLVGGPLHVSVDHQREFVAEVFAHGGDFGDVLAQVVATHFHLDGAEALGKVPVRLSQERAGVEVKIDAAGIAWHLRVVTTEQLPQWQVGTLCLEIIEGNVEGRLREHGGASTSAVVETPPHLAPEMLDAIGIFTCNQVADGVL